MPGIGRILLLRIILWQECDPMWLPTPVYERIPQFYVLLGMLFFTNGLYLGFEFEITLYYLGAGILSFLYGLGVFATRLIRRQKQPMVINAPEA